MTYCAFEECLNLECDRNLKNYNEKENPDNIPLGKCDFHEKCEDYKKADAIRCLPWSTLAPFSSLDKYINGNTEPIKAADKTVKQLV